MQTNIPHEFKDHQQNVVKYTKKNHKQTGNCHEIVKLVHYSIINR